MKVRPYEPENLTSHLTHAINELTVRSRGIEIDWFGQQATLNIDWTRYSTGPSGAVFEIRVDTASFFLPIAAFHGLATMQTILQGALLQDLATDLQAAVVDIACEPLLSQFRANGDVQLNYAAKLAEGLYWLTYQVSGQDGHSVLASGSFSANCNGLDWLGKNLAEFGCTPKKSTRFLALAVEVITAEVPMSVVDIENLAAGDLILPEFKMDGEKVCCLLETECGERCKGLLNPDGTLEALNEDGGQIDRLFVTNGFKVVEVVVGSGTRYRVAAGSDRFAAKWCPFPASEVILRIDGSPIAAGKLINVQGKDVVFIERVLLPRSVGTV